MSLSPSQSCLGYPINTLALVFAKHGPRTLPGRRPRHDEERAASHLRRSTVVGEARRQPPWSFDARSWNSKGQKRHPRPFTRHDGLRNEIDVADKLCAPAPALENDFTAMKGFEFESDDQR